MYIADYVFDLTYNIICWCPWQVMLFPEGTDLTARTKARSDEFARKNGVECYQYVLHPRTTGFTFLAKEMQNRKLCFCLLAHL